MSNPLSDKDLDAFLTQAESRRRLRARRMERYVELVHHAESSSRPCRPAGEAGTSTAESVRASAGFIEGGEAHLEHVETHARGDTLVVANDRAAARSSRGAPGPELSLRVTHVYRRKGDDWHLVHRHADPLVDAISLTTCKRDAPLSHRIHGVHPFSGWRDLQPHGADAPKELVGQLTNRRRAGLAPAGGTATPSRCSSMSSATTQQSNALLLQAAEAVDRCDAQVKA